MSNAAPDIFAPIALPYGWRLASFASIDSTNEEAKRRILQGQSGPMALLAAEQTAGRGRRGRSWISQPGNLYLSLVVPLSGPLAEAAQCSFVTGLALAAAADEMRLDADVRLKWPNDLLLGGRKAAGILLELETDPAQGTQSLIIGIGVNLAFAPDLGGANVYPATSFDLHAKSPVRIEAFCAALLRHFDAGWQLWQERGFAPVRAAWLARAHGLNQPVTARLADGEVLTGAFTDLDPQGALLLGLDGGQSRRITAGDIYFTEVAA